MLSILLTAPTGAVGIAVSGPRLLRRSETKEETGDKGEVEPILDGSNRQMDSTVWRGPEWIGHEVLGTFCYPRFYGNEEPSIQGNVWTKKLFIFLFPLPSLVLPYLFIFDVNNRYEFGPDMNGLCVTLTNSFLIWATQQAMRRDKKRTFWVIFLFFMSVRLPFCGSRYCRYSRFYTTRKYWLLSLSSYKISK